MKKILLVLLSAVFLPGLAQAPRGWKQADGIVIATENKLRNTEYSEQQQLFTLDEAAFRAVLSSVKYQGANVPGTVISIPTTAGSEEFIIWETSNFAPGLRARYPEIKSYVGRGVSDKTAYLRFSVSPLGVQTMVLRADKGAEFIEPYTKDASVYVLFDSQTRIKGNLPFICSTVDQRVNQVALNRAASAQLSDDQVFRTYRLALSCTGEYAQFFGGTVAGALSGMNATMTRVNGVMDVDLAVKLEIIDNNEQVIFTNPNTDPYANAWMGSGGAWNTQLQNTLTNIIGNAGYDIGHLFGGSGGGGNAGCIGCVCVDDTPSQNDTNKGSGFTSPADGIPQGDSFDIDYVTHEMGHQLGANHTFSFNVEGTGVNIEPGSGVTIMGYAGVTGNFDIAQSSLPFFAYRSIQQIQNTLIGTCAQEEYLENQPPMVNAGPAITIPKSTPFVLRGTGSDPDGDPVSWVWEQNDNGTFATTGGNSFPSPTKTQGPTFRSFMPSESPDRFMPSYNTVLAGQLANTWEALPSVARQLKFTLTGRDMVPGAGQTSTSSKTVTVTGTAGPFAVTSQNSPGVSWSPGETETITWSVNNTTALAGSANVNIKLSVDGGITWPYTLASNTPNDGSHQITVPEVSGENCRIWIEPTGNIYYAINSTPFSIGYECQTAALSPNVPIPDGVGNNMPGAALTSTIQVPDFGSVQNLKVSLGTNHTWVGDLVITLTHPDGTQRTIWNRGCNNNQTSGINANFQDGAGPIQCGSPVTGTFNPNQSLAVLNGKPSAGTWTLTVRDFYGQDTGALQSWGLDFGCTLSNSDFNMEPASFVIFPNPSNGNFTITYNSTRAGDVDVEIHDMRGRKIFGSSYANSGTFSQNINLDRVQSGVYLVSVRQGDVKQVKRIVVE